MNKYILLIVGWSLYFSIHSILASNSIKKYLEKLTGKLFKFYRIFYNLLSIVGLLLMLLMNGAITSPQLIHSTNATRYFSLMLATAGIFIIKAAFNQFKLKGFLGFENDDGENFQSNGILKHIRHPLYSGTILIAVGFWLFSPNLTTLITVGCILAYLPVGIWLEERKLIAKYGEAYKKYKEDVPALIPKINFKKLLTLPLLLFVFF